MVNYILSKHFAWFINHTRTIKQPINTGPKAKTNMLIKFNDIVFLLPWNNQGGKDGHFVLGSDSTSAHELHEIEGPTYRDSGPNCRKFLNIFWSIFNVFEIFFSRTF